MKEQFDIALVGAGIMGSTTALFLSRAGLKVALIDKNLICRQASGVNAGTLTMHMTRAKLIPFAKKGWDMWMTTEKWLGKGFKIKKKNGLCLAFTDEEADLLITRSKARMEQGAPIKIISSNEAIKIEPGVNKKIKIAAFCEIDGYVSAYQTGLIYKKALEQEGVKIFENCEIKKIDINQNKFTIISESLNISSKNLVISSGAWIEKLLKLLNVSLKIKCLAQQLIVTERIKKILDCVITVANGKLSLKQFENGTALIGGGWPGIGDTEIGPFTTIPDNLLGNMRLACYAVPELKESRVSRVWLGLEAETSDAMPIIGEIPNIQNAYVIGSVHSGYTSGPYMGYLLAQKILEKNVDLSLFKPSRLL